MLPSRADDEPNSPKPIDGRSKTVGGKPMFRDAFDNRRCLVSADGFYS
ncbi:hypothetical protein BRC82_09045 [Halobacteriales archaeon QS_1_67_19]|nr:MAG: hypothetical protein BRC82_09045 [Halobacteriales archaeon QS_1_67_19]